MESSIKKAGLLPSLCVSLFLTTAALDNTANAAPVKSTNTQVAWWGGYWGSYGWGPGYYYRPWGGYYRDGCQRNCWRNRWGYLRCNTRCW